MVFVKSMYLLWSIHLFRWTDHVDPGVLSCHKAGLNLLDVVMTPPLRVADFFFFLKVSCCWGCLQVPPLGWARAPPLLLAGDILIGAS